MQRLRLLDLKNSRMPSAVGVCATDTNRIAQFAQSAQARLLMAKEASDEGWWGSWAEVALTASRATPYITLPRDIARLEAIAVCDRVIPVNNQFYEYLQYGNGRLPKLPRAALCRQFITSAYSRNNAVTFTDLTNGPQYIQVFCTDPADVGGRRRILLQGTDNNDTPIYSQDVLVQVLGQYVVFQSPFSQAPQQFNSITGIQKDVTQGQVQIFQVDPTTGESILLLTMEPGETTASYRRYYLNSLPRDCCAGQGTTATVTVTAIAKLELIPALVDTDYLLIQSLEALIEECQAVRYSEMDSANAAQLEAKCHARAIGHLNGQLAHYMGKNDPAVGYFPFGSADLRKVRISMV